MVFQTESMSEGFKGVCSRDKTNPMAQASGIHQRTHGAKFCSSQAFTEMTEMQVSAEPGLASPAGLVCNCR